MPASSSYVSYVSPLLTHFAVPLRTSYMLPPFSGNSADRLQTCCMCSYETKRLLLPTSDSQTCLSPIPMERRSLLELSVFAVLLSIECLLKTQICHHKNDVVSILCYLVQCCSPAFNFVLLMILYDIWLFYIVLCFHSVSLLKYHFSVNRYYCNISHWS